MPRSVHVHPDYRIDVATALERNGFLTQGDLAAHLEIALCTVSNFCRGVNVSIAKFEAICEALALDKKQIIQPKSVQSSVATSTLSSPANPIEFFAYNQAWVGRAALISDLSDRLQTSCRILFLTGMAGIGKTALAERLIIESQDRSLLRENFDSQEQAIDFGSVAARLLEKCGQMVTPDERQDVRQLTSRLVHYLQNNRCLLAIDSLEEVLQGRAYGNLGNVHQAQNNFSQALKYYLKDLVIAQEIGDRMGAAHALGNITTAYASLKNFPQATESAQQQLQMTQELG
jgi:transcriptional regulator with XRE-family HTH domain